jgi:hypothetical protein
MHKQIIYFIEINSNCQFTSAAKIHHLSMVPLRIKPRFKFLLDLPACERADTLTKEFPLKDAPRAKITKFMGHPSRVSTLPFRKGSLAGFPGARSYSVLQCCSRKGGMRNDKCQSPNGEFSGRAEK